MEFFNRKEEVLEVQLTPYGKHKLSMGKFKPVHYAFFDSDVIYNTYFNTETGYQEHQKDIEQRIKQSLRPKTQPIRYGVESKINQYSDNKIGEPNALTPVQLNAALENLREPVSPSENTSTMRSPIGNSSANSFYLPSWKVSPLLGKIDYSEPSYTGSMTQQKQLVEDIPQININVEYQTAISDEDSTFDTNPDELFSAVYGKYDNPNYYSPETYEDGTKVFIKKQFSLLDIIEEHVDDKIHNFDIEVFEIIQEPFKANDGTVVNQESLKSLKFRKNEYLELGQYEIFSNNLTQNNKIDDTYVEYYFEIKVDEEIEDVVRSATPNLVDASDGIPANNFEEPC